MAKILVQINGTNLTPLIKKYQVDYNVLVKDDGRNAAGNAIINIVNRKTKLVCVFRPMNDAEMASLLNLINPFVLTVTYWDTKTQAQVSKSMYTGTPSTDFYTNKNDQGLFNDFSLNFIEL